VPIIAPDSSRVVYSTDQPSSIQDLLGQQISGGGVRNLSRIGFASPVTDQIISPNGQWIVFEVLYSLKAAPDPSCA
jgi:Tol biopolymer transport system component